MCWASRCPPTGSRGQVCCRSQQDAARPYTDKWRRFIHDKYGCEPVVRFFESPVIVDNSRELLSTG
jgi:hypothetical protein